LELLFLDDDAASQRKGLPVSARPATGGDFCQNGEGGKASLVHRPLVVERSPQLLPRHVSQLGMTDLVKEPW
jgi:hypothetical protein